MWYRLDTGHSRSAKHVKDGHPFDVRQSWVHITAPQPIGYVSLIIPLDFLYLTLLLVYSS